jgi:hypothetical protein
LPFTAADVQRVAHHLTSYHTRWGDAETTRIVEAYPVDAYKTLDLLGTRMGTDFCFSAPSHGPHAW